MRCSLAHPVPELGAVQRDPLEGHEALVRGDGRVPVDVQARVVGVARRGSEQPGRGLADAVQGGDGGHVARPLRVGHRSSCDKVYHLLLPLTMCRTNRRRAVAVYAARMPTEGPDTAASTASTGSRDGRSTRWDPHRRERRLAIIQAAVTAIEQHGRGRPDRRRSPSWPACRAPTSTGTSTASRRSTSPCRRYIAGEIGAARAAGAGRARVGARDHRRVDRRAPALDRGAPEPVPVPGPARLRRAAVRHARHRGRQGRLRRRADGADPALPDRCSGSTPGRPSASSSASSGWSTRPRRGGSSARTVPSAS